MAGQMLYVMHIGCRVKPVTFAISQEQSKIF